MKKIHKKKMIAPIIITILLIAYFVFIGTTFSIADMNLLGKVLVVLIPIILAGVIIAMLKERINEIRSGEEDDLGKY